MLITPRWTARMRDAQTSTSSARCSVVCPCDAVRCGAAMISGTLVPSSTVRRSTVRLAATRAQPKPSVAGLTDGLLCPEALLSQMPTVIALRTTRTATSRTLYAHERWGGSAVLTWKIMIVLSVWPSASTWSTILPTCSSMNDTALQPNRRQASCANSALTDGARGLTHSIRGAGMRWSPV
eukprot:COSAG04_NODE_8794_length_931_cov_0.746394_2_plen_181_part_00